MNSFYSSFSLTSLFRSFCYCFSCCVIDLVFDTSCQGQMLGLGILPSEMSGKSLKEAGEGEKISDAFRCVLFVFVNTSVWFL